MLTDKEVLEQRLDIFSLDAWAVLQDELMNMATSMESILNINDEKTLFVNKGAVGVLNMIVNLEETTKLALDNLEE